MRNNYILYSSVENGQKITISKIKIGALVLIKAYNATPLHWPMARVIETHAGAVGLIRVVTLRMKI